ncbi:MAG: trypsin-like peptidase domain-containing protein [Planctomycetes bacterium]|nr:trypsin-like peptidase domain-containing protein [Planctomycetota bacterium]
MTLRHLLRTALLTLLAVSPGCLGFSPVGQDWSQASDPRLRRLCLVTGYGSGVTLARDRSGLWILTCAHLVEGEESVDVHVRDEHEDRWHRCAARVVLCAHRTKYDLALLLIEQPPPGEPFRLSLADPLPDGQRRDGADLLGAYNLERPLVHRGPLVGSDVFWGSGPDEFGAMSYMVTGACMFDGILGANSGSPIFDGERLFGLHHVSRYHARLDGEVVMGIGISDPRRIRTFLTGGRHEWLLGDDAREG